MKSPMTSHEKESIERVATWKQNDQLIKSAAEFLKASVPEKYSYNFFWLNRPIIQYPQDIVAAQEVVWKVKPDLIIETGIAHGGSLILSASILTLLDYVEAIEKDLLIDPKKPTRKVVGIDIDIRSHNKKAINEHPLSNRIELIQGSSVDKEVINLVKLKAMDYRRVMVLLDSNHTHQHVLSELEAYAPLVSVGSYCIVYDTLIEDMPKGYYTDRPWDKGNNPMTAVREFLLSHPNFEIDKRYDDKLLISVAKGGFLKRIC